MLWSLSLLTVIGQCFFVTSRVYEYHLIKKEKTWHEAKAYCREKYTDLAVVSDMNDAERIRELVKQTGAWIGLHSNQGAENRRWHWSRPELPDVELSDIKEYFHKGKSNDKDGDENCVDVKIKMLNDGKCSTEHQFICFNATGTNPPNERFILIKEKMNWTKAQQHCREHYTDMAGGPHLFNNQKFLSLLSESTRRWIGLFRDTWRWSNGSNSFFRHWNQPEDVFQEGKCAFVKEGSGKWDSDDCDSKKPFFCYDGQCDNTHCSYKYCLIEEEKTWSEAQDYCRENYTDLAVVSNVSDTERIRELVKQTGAWIGLYSNKGTENKRWHWSRPELPDVELSDIQKYFHHGEPNDKHGRENCVDVRIKMLNNEKCSTEHQFICFNGTNPPNERFILINEKMNWTEAQQHCREHYTDLAGGPHLFNNQKFLSLLSENTWWIGLFRDTWRWSDGSSSSFRHWNQPEDVFQEGKCAFVMEGSGKWDSEDCGSKKPFFCYDDNVVLVKENMTWEEALYYCREKYDDLVSIKNDRDQRWVQERAKNASTPHVWLGLRYTCTLVFWFWISNEVVDYTNWAEGEEANGCDMSGAMKTSGDYKWYKQQDEQRLNFLCSKR